MQLSKPLLNAAFASVVGFAGSLATLSHAGVISHAGYAYDTSTDIVTSDGLQWLRWDSTVNQSIGTALGTYGGSGWRLASNAEMRRLMNSFAFGGFVFDADENTRETARFSFADSSSENEVTNIFISMFGDTYKASGEPLIGTVDEPYALSAAYYGADGDGDGLYNFASVSDDYTTDTAFGSIVNFAFATMAADFQNDFTPNSTFGVALVRSAVPSPGTLALVALGLVGVRVSRSGRVPRRLVGAAS